MTYQDKLKDPRWQKRRLEVFSAHNFTCEDCGRKDKQLSVHHCYYIRKREPWDYEDELLMCLCLECHEFRQGREEALHFTLAHVLRKTPVNVLEEAAWDDLHDAIKQANQLKQRLPTAKPTATRSVEMRTETK